MVTGKRSSLALTSTYSVVITITEWSADLTKFFQQSRFDQNVEILIIDYSASGDAVPTSIAISSVKVNRCNVQSEASALNLGLELATHEWVIFPNSCTADLFQRLKLIDRQLAKCGHQDISIINVDCAHASKRNVLRRLLPSPQRTKFSTARNALKSDLFGPLSKLVLADCLFSRAKLMPSNVRFSEAMRVEYAQPHFIRDLLTRLPESVVMRVKATKSLRDPKNKRHVLPLSEAQQAAAFLAEVKGWKAQVEDNLSKVGTLGVPLQRALMDEIIKHLRILITHNSKPIAWPPATQQRYLEDLRWLVDQFEAESFHREAQTIKNELVRYALLATFRNTTFQPSPVISRYDRWAQECRVSYLSQAADCDALIEADGIQLEKRHTKAQQFVIGSLPVCVKHSFWCDYRQNGVSFRLGTSPAHLLRRRLPWWQAGPIGKLLSSRTFTNAAAKFKTYWVIADKPDKADDSGEHFYRYVMQNHPATKAVFALSKKSPDWKRLKDEGFKIVEPGSLHLYWILLRARWIISSHADVYVRGPFRWMIWRSLYRFAFLQHGVISQDLSGWLNNMQPEVFVTSTKDEFRSIVSKRSPYIATEKEVILSGLPRHEALSLMPQVNDTIFIMPTWRKNLTTRSTDMKWVLNSEFTHSDYVHRWREFLCSPELYDLAMKHGKNIVFCPHPLAADGISAFNLPSYIQVRNVNQLPSIQPLIAEAAVLITDYSSIAFDAAYIEKPVIYYQFDAGSFFAGHTYTKGYFDYQRDGFGPVLSDLPDLIAALSTQLSGHEPSAFAERRKRAFPSASTNSNSQIYSRINK